MDKREFLTWLDQHPQATLEDAYTAGGHNGYQQGVQAGKLGDDEWIAPEENPYPVKRSWFASRH